MSISFDRAAEYYDQTRGYPPGVAARIGQALVDAAGATPVTRLLELGVGTGRIALPIVRAGHAYTGVDLSPRMLDRLREALRSIPGADERVTLVQGDVAALPFPDRAFDVVLTVHVYHLVGDRAQALAESARVLARPGIALNGRDDSGGDDGDEVRAAWARIVRELGHEPPTRPHASTYRIADEWRRLGAATDELVGVEWEEGRSPEQDVEHLARRLWSNTWEIPDAIAPEVARRLRAWAAAYYGDTLDIPIVRRRRFIIERARFV